MEYEEALRIELLQLATLLIRWLPNELKQHRKELIKFGWNHLKREESPAKQWAFVNVCTFLEAYQAPEKIILQVEGGSVEGDVRERGERYFGMYHM